MEKDGDELRLSISSEEPCKRYDWMNDEEYYEVLSHLPEDIGAERLKSGLPILFNHRTDMPLGNAKSYKIEGNRCTVSGIKWLDSDLAKTMKAGAESGAMPFTSVGYRILDNGTCTGQKDGIPVYRFKWAANEGSIVSVPADITVGANKDDKSQLTLREFSVEVTKDIDLTKNKGKKRSNPTTRSMAKPATATKENEEGEEDTFSIEVVNERLAEQKKTSKERAKKINEYYKAALDKKRIDPEKANTIRDQYLFGDKEDADFADFRDSMLGEFENMTRIDEPNPKIGMNKKEMKAFRFGEIIARLGQGLQLEGVQKEATDWAREKYGKIDSIYGRQGVTFPDDVLECNLAEVHDLNAAGVRNLLEDQRRGFGRMGMTRALQAGSYTAGGALVAVELMAGAWIELLRNHTVIFNLGITELSGLVGNIAIPKQTGGATVYWNAEGQAVTESDQTVGQIYGTPHRLSVDTAYTLQLANQSSLPVEMFIRNDMAKQTAVEEDRVAWLGGLNPGEPVGILNTTGVGAGVTFGGNATRLLMTQFRYDIANANALIGKLTLVTSPTTQYYLENTLEVANSTFPIFIWKKGGREINGQDTGDVIGIESVSTKNVTTSQVIVGVMSEFIKFRWAGLNMIVDPYSLKKSEQIELTCHQWLDQNLRYPTAFDTSTDAPTQP